MMTRAFVCFEKHVRFYKEGLKSHDDPFASSLPPPLLFLPHLCCWNYMSKIYVSRFQQHIKFNAAYIDLVLLRALAFFHRISRPHF